MQLTFLGTGTGGTLDFFNTCFVISNDIGHFLVDTGGGCEVRRRLKMANINFKNRSNRLAKKLCVPIQKLCLGPRSIQKRTFRSIKIILMHIPSTNDST